MVLAESAGCRLDVLCVQHRRNIRRNELVLRHFVGIHPDAHTVIGAEYHHIAHAADTLDTRLHVDFHIIVQELTVVFPFGRIEGKCFQFGILLLHRSHTDAGHFGRKQAQGGGNAVLYVHGCHIRIAALLEIDIDGGHPAVGGSRCDVSHIFHAVDGFFQRDDDGFLYGFRIGSWIGGVHLYGRRCDVGILFYGQVEYGDDSHQHNQHRDDNRQYRAIYKKFQVHKAISPFFRLLG